MKPTPEAKKDLKKKKKLTPLLCITNFVGGIAFIILLIIVRRNGDVLTEEVFPGWNPCGHMHLHSLKMFTSMTT